MNQKELNEILDLHKKWVNNDGGQRAILSGVDWSYVDFSNADLSGADLSNANFTNANLTNANFYRTSLTNAILTNVYLRNCVGNSTNIKTLFIFDEYNISYTKDLLQIGCELHKIEEWWCFDNNMILEMDGKEALKFWRKNKETIKEIIKNNPAY